MRRPAEALRKIRRAARAAAWAAALLVSLESAALAQESPAQAELPRALVLAGETLSSPEALAVATDGHEPDAPETPLPLTLLSPGPGREDTGDWSFGPIFGIMRARGGDKTNLFAGAQLRATLSDFFAIEFSSTLHRTTFLHDTLRATQYPQQLAAKIFPLPEAQVQPYLALGAGYYYTQLEYRFPLNAQFADQNKGAFGGQAGAGIELRHGSAAVALEADYLLINLNANALSPHSFDYWQVIATISVFF